MTYKGSQFERSISENWKKEKNSNHNFGLINSILDAVRSFSFLLKGIKFLVLFWTINLFHKWGPRKGILNSLNFLQQKTSLNILVALIVYLFLGLIVNRL